MTPVGLAQTSGSQAQASRALSPADPTIGSVKLGDWTTRKRQHLLPLRGLTAGNGGLGVSGRAVHPGTTLACGRVDPGVAARRCLLPVCG